VLSEAGDFAACTFNKRRGHPCHLHDLDRYTYDLVVDVPQSDGQPSLPLVAADWFRSIAARIRPDSEISFAAVLSAASAVPGSGVELQLESIRCVGGEPCKIGSGEVELEHGGSGGWKLLVGRAVHSVWNFFFSPLVAFSS